MRRGCKSPCICNFCFIFHHIFFYSFVQRYFFFNKFFNSLVKFHIIPVCIMTNNNNYGWNYATSVTMDGIMQPADSLSDKGDSSSCSSSTSCTSHTMNVVLRVSGNVKVDDHIHMRNVQASTSYICSNQDGPIPATELAESS